MRFTSGKNCNFVFMSVLGEFGYERKNNVRFEYWSDVGAKVCLVFSLL